jgi:hypothetical protein
MVRVCRRHPVEMRSNSSRCSDQRFQIPLQNFLNTKPSPTTAMADARMEKAPIEPKDVDAIVDYLLSIRDANQARGRRVALLVKHQQTSYRRRAA